MSASWLAGLPASTEVCELRGSYREDDNLLLMPTCVAIAALLLFICAHRLGALDLATNATSAKQAGLERGPTCGGTVLNVRNQRTRIREHISFLNAEIYVYAPIRQLNAEPARDRERWATYGA